jgi:hypothetical protein
MLEAGELIEAQLDSERDLVELGELVDSSGKPLSAHIATATQGSITCFKSVGLAMQVRNASYFSTYTLQSHALVSLCPQDVMIATLVNAKAEAHSIGILVSDFD